MKRIKKLFLLPLIGLIASCTPTSATESELNDFQKIYKIYKDNGGELTYEEWLLSMDWPEGKKGADGTSLFAGQGAPAADKGQTGDKFIDFDTWSYYVKGYSGWILKGTIEVPESSSSSTSSSQQASSSKASSSRPIITRTVTFDYNYEGAPEDTVVVVERRTTVTKPATDPTRDGYTFLGWTTDESGYSPYDFNTSVTTDLTLYAAWEADNETETNRYVFEAEYAPSALTFDGATYSGGAKGKSCIGYDYDGDLKASNGYYVHFMYIRYDPERNYGSRIEFNFESAAAGTISLLIRVSAEYYDRVVTPEAWEAKLNNTQLNYETFSFTDVPVQGAGYKVFEDHTLALNVNVQQGANKLEFITVTTAPMLDCLKIKSSTTLTWDEADPTQVPTVE